MKEIRREQRKAKLPPSLHKTFEKAKTSRAAAIKIFCVECMGGSQGYAKAVRECTAPDCALYPFRPYQKQDDDDESEEDMKETE